MSYTNTTKNLKLPQWLDTDYPNWNPDTNEAFEKIDTFAGEAKEYMTQNDLDKSGTTTDINGIRSEIAQMKEDIQTNTTNITSNDEDISGLQGKYSKQAADITGINDQIKSIRGSLTSAESAIEANERNISLNTENIGNIKRYMPRYMYGKEEDVEDICGLKITSPYYVSMQDGERIPSGAGMPVANYVMFTSAYASSLQTGKSNVLILPNGSWASVLRRVLQASDNQVFNPGNSEKFIFPFSGRIILTSNISFGSGVVIDTHYGLHVYNSNEMCVFGNIYTTKSIADITTPSSELELIPADTQHGANPTVTMEGMLFQKCIDLT